MAEDQHTGAEPPSVEERAREEVDRVLRLLGDGDRGTAVAMLKEMQPVDQGEVLLELDQAVLSELSVEEIVQILERLDPDESSEIAAGIDSRALAVILDRTRSDMAADILRHLPADRARETLAAMTEADEIAPLLGYSDEIAGGLMVLDYPVVSDYMTAGIALDVLRLLGRRAEEFGAIFVVDAEGGLLGYITVTRLALSPIDVAVRDIMRPEIVSVPVETDQEECARLMERYDLRHLPVVDPEHKLIGIIQVENVVHVMEEEATEDMFRMAGLAGERVLSSLGNSVRSRLPWLTTNLGTVFLAALVINLFESTIAKVAVLAVFLPVVAGQGGIAGTQTLTLVVRSMALGEISRHSGIRLIGRELLLSLVHGLLLAAAVGVAAYFWKGSIMLGVIVGAAMLGNMLVAGLAGSSVPLLLKRFGMDPAVSSVVFVTTFTDVLGFLIFLGMAALLIERLA
jgi:magnesium transporter